MLGSWRDTPTRAAIVDYVERRAPADGRIAVFDNDGTLWCEKPLPIQLDFTLRRLAEQAEADASLRERQRGDDQAPPGRRRRSAPAEVHGIPRERVIGSGMGLEWRDAGLVYKSKIEFFDDDPEREFGYVAGAEAVLDGGHVEISVKEDWTTVFEEA